MILSFDDRYFIFCLFQHQENQWDIIERMAIVKLARRRENGRVSSRMRRTEIKATPALRARKNEQERARKRRWRASYDEKARNKERAQTRRRWRLRGRYARAGRKVLRA